MIEFRQENRGNLKIWKQPERDKKYIIPADVAEGLEGGNFSAAHVIDLSNLEQVSVWHGLEEPYQFGRILFNLGEFYNSALLIPERNNNGISTIDYLRANNYPNIFQMMKLEGYDRDDTERLGWVTNLSTRPLIIDALKEAVRSNSLILHDPETLAEMRTFIRNPKNGKIEAAAGSMDDLVISLAIGCYVYSTLPRESQYVFTEGSYLDRMKERWGEPVVKIGRSGY